VKIYESQSVKSGNIIVRQRGLQFKPGMNTKIGKDYTLFAVQPGVVKYESVGKDKFVSVLQN
jgi:large subunit ribosomal protein L27